MDAFGTENVSRAVAKFSGHSKYAHLATVVALALQVAVATQSWAAEPSAVLAASTDSEALPVPQPSLFKTICVRLCDGYFWPVSERAHEQKFKHDAAICKSQCAIDARLFFLPFGSRDIASAKDLRGRNYKTLTNAFAYKQALKPMCTCKPAPWSSAAAARHASYSKGQTVTNRPTPHPRPTPQLALSPPVRLENKPTNNEEPKLEKPTPNHSGLDAQAAAQTFERERTNRRVARPVSTRVLRAGRRAWTN